MRAADGVVAVEKHRLSMRLVSRRLARAVTLVSIFATVSAFVISDGASGWLMALISAVWIVFAWLLYFTACAYFFPAVRTNRETPAHSTMAEP